MDGQRGGKREQKDSEGIYFPFARLPFFSLRVKDKPGGAVVWPSDCVRRLAVPHTGTPLITGAGLSLLDTKTPHTHTHTHANTDIMIFARACKAEKKTRMEIPEHFLQKHT